MDRQSMDKNNEQIIKETTEKLFSLLGVKANISLSTSEDTIIIEVATEETGMLIGYHGETLESLQLVLSLCISKQLGEFQRISVEIGEYKKNRTDYLKQLVEHTKEQVLFQKKQIALPNLKAWERREAHMLLQDDPDVVTESIGEGRERVFTIRPKEL